MFSSLKVDKYCTVELSHKGEQFFSNLFDAHDKDRDGCLSPVELKSLFYICTEEPQLLRKCLYNINHQVIAEFKQIYFENTGHCCSVNAFRDGSLHKDGYRFGLTVLLLRLIQH